MKKRVADIIIETLVENGITDTFCVVGGGAMFLDNALAINPNMKTYFNHHEQGCAMAAEAYARYKGKMALCCVTSGPGGTNTLTGVMGAYQDNIPMIVMSGQVRYNTTIAECNLPIRQRGEQEFDIVNSVQNMTKYAKMIIDPLAVKQEVQKAIDIAMSGRRGPVWLDIPLNVQSAMIEEDELLPVLPSPDVISCSIEEFDNVISILRNAERPCILAGSGIRSSAQFDNFVKSIEKLQIPVVGGCIVTDALYHEHPLYFGSSGVVGTREGNFVLQNADVIIVLGSRLAFKQTGFVQENFAPNARIVMIDADEHEHKKPGLNVNKFVHCELKAFFEKIIKDNISIKAPSEWITYCNKLKKHFDLFENAIGAPDDRVNAYSFWKTYAQMENDDSITVLGNNSGVSARLQTGVMKYEQRTLANLNCGSMGYDIPASIGAAVASQKPVVLVTGDGSFMMNLQELQTIAHNNLPIKIVLLSNEGYCGISQTCKNYFGGNNFGCTEESGVSFPDFKKVAEAFGFEYGICKTDSSVEDSLKWLLENDKFSILEVFQQFDNPASPRIVSRLNADGTSMPAYLHDMFPFLDKKELDSFMIKEVGVLINEKND